jgi:hypothetical protein
MNAIEMSAIELPGCQRRRQRVGLDLEMGDPGAQVSEAKASA